MADLREDLDPIDSLDFGNLTLEEARTFVDSVADMEARVRQIAKDEGWEEGAVDRALASVSEEVAACEHFAKAIELVACSMLKRNS